MALTEGDGQAGAESSARPQSLMLSFLGIYLLGRDVAVYSGSIIDVFARLDVSEEAVRSTLARMVKRNLLTRHRQGRKMYFGLMPHAADVLEDGRRRIWETGAVNRDWDGTWTWSGSHCPTAGGASAMICVPGWSGPGSACCRADCGSLPAPRTSGPCSPRSNWAIST